MLVFKKDKLLKKEESPLIKVLNLNQTGFRLFKHLLLQIDSKKDTFACICLPNETGISKLGITQNQK